MARLAIGLPTMMATQSPDTDTLINAAPRLRAQLAQLQATLSLQMNKPAFLVKNIWCSPSPENHTEEARLHHSKKPSTSNFLTASRTHLLNTVLLSQFTSHTGAHFMQLSSEAYEAGDRCFRVSVASRLMLPLTAAPNAADVVQSCPNKSAAGLMCDKSVDIQQQHCYGCRYGGGVDRRHAAEARCLADVTHSHSGTKVFFEQEVLALTRVVNGQREHARMDLVFNLNGSVTYLDVSIVAPFSCNPSLVSPDQDTWPKELRRANSTEIHTSTSPLSCSRPQADLDHTPENSSLSSCETLTTLH